MVDKSVQSSIPGQGARHLDMPAARSATQAEAAGRPSDMDTDDGVTSGGWTNNVDGTQPPSNGVNADAQPASVANRVRPGGGVTP